MKKLLAFVILFYALSNCGYSQNDYLHDANLQLRGIFKYITYPNNNIKFLYERSAKLSDSVFYTNNYIDTLETAMWNQLYEEMFYAAHDTTNLINVREISNYGNSFYRDTVPLAIMDYDYYYLIPNALNTNTYFNFDTTNNILTDKPNRPTHPFMVGNIFTACPTVTDAYFSNVVYRIDPQLIFKDINNSSPYNDSIQLKIDFGDGNGWQDINPTITKHYNVLYPSNGEKIIKTAIFDKSSTRPIKTSTSKINIISSGSSTPPDYFIEIEGMEVGVYNNCNTDQKQKIIIYVEGIDLLDCYKSKSRNTSQIYDEMIHKEYIEELRNFGYQFYVVNWDNSRIDMRFNALYLINLIEYLKNENSDNEFQFVVIGESMGGVVARYALTFMETENYLNGNFQPFFIEENDISNSLYVKLHPEIKNIGLANRNVDLLKQRHKTRELITIDSPHRGANIPLSIQHAYRKAMSLVAGSSHELFTKGFNLFLDSKSARQMLIYHINGKISSSNISGYNCDESKTTFYDQLYNIGNYPKYCKLVALTNGSIAGQNQSNGFNNLDRVPNDRLMDFDFNIKTRILYIPVPLLSGALNLRTNPDGTGTFYNASIGNFVIKIKLKYFGVRVSYTLGNIYNDNQTAVGVKPYCSSAGGFEGEKLLPSNIATTEPSFKLSNRWILNLFQYQYTNNGQGCLTFDSHLGLNGLYSLNFEFHFCTDGFNFGFIPVSSALDYGDPYLPLNYNIETKDDIITKNNNTPFDVIIGNPGKYNIMNRRHLNYRDLFIYNITRTEADGWTSENENSKFAYYSCAKENVFNVKRSLLCLEIGDEELYLENLTLNRKADFQTEFDIKVNERNPYYQYTSQLVTQNDLQGAYSKERPFQSVTGDLVNFYFDSQNSPSQNPGLSFSIPTFTGLFNKIEEPLPMCCTHYSLRNFIIPRKIIPNSGTNSFLKVFPNPSNGENTINIEFKLSTDNLPTTLSVYNIMGQKVGLFFLNNEVDLKQSTVSISLQQLNLTTGIYLLEINNSCERLCQKIVIQ